MTDIGIRDISVSFRDNKISNISLVQGDALTRGFDITFVNAKGETLPVDDDYIVELVAVNSKDKDTPYACRHEVVDDKYRVMIPPEALSESGSVTIQLVFYQKSTGAVIHTIEQKCPVYRSRGQEVVESNNLYVDITKLRLTLEEIETLKAECEDLIIRGKTAFEDEDSRIDAENKRIIAEETRTDSENKRNESEIKREIEEESRKLVENERVNNESRRLYSETLRELAENKRISSEKIRVDNEKVRVTSEEERVTAEEQRNLNEKERIVTHSAIEDRFSKTNTRIKKVEDKVYETNKWDTSKTPGPVYPTPEQNDYVSEFAFYGDVLSTDLINGNDLALKIGLTAGNSTNSDAGWLKFMYKGKILFVAKKNLRTSLSWDSLNEAGVVYGDKTIEFGGFTYKVRLLRGISEEIQPDPKIYQDRAVGTPNQNSEWNRLLCPISDEAPDKWQYPNNVASPTIKLATTYTNLELEVEGKYSWCQESTGRTPTSKLTRGFRGVSYAYNYESTNVSSNGGWRPVLELVE